MKELFLFIRNNRIIYKVSIVSILVLMLISVMQINPKNVEKNSVSLELVEMDEAIMFYARDNYGIFTSYPSSNSIDSTTLERLGISYGGKDDDGYHKIVLSGTNFKSKSNMGLVIFATNVNIVLTEGTTNKISSSNNIKGEVKEFNAIENMGGNIKITGKGTLEVSCYNSEENNESVDNNMPKNAIVAYHLTEETGKIIIESGTVIAKANGANGTAIYGRMSVEINGGTVEAYGGDKGSTSGIKSDKKINIENATVSVKASSEDQCVSGIYTEYDGHGDSITISNNAKVNVDVSTTNDTCSGSGISSGKLDINNSTVNVKMNGNSLAGLKTVYGTGGDYPAVPAEYRRRMLINESTITITGDKCYDSAAIAAYDSDASIIGSKINIDVKNSEKVVDESGLFGIGAWKDRVDCDDGGNITITNSYVKDNVYTNNGAAIFAKKDITINTSNIEAYADGVEGTRIVGLHAGGKLIVNSGRIAAKGKTLAIDITDGANSLTLDTSNSVGMIAVSTDYDIASLEEYDANSWWDYKYMEIGTIYDYYLRYDPATGNLYKVWGLSAKSERTEGPLDFSNVPGLDKSYTPNDDGEYELIMDGFNFVTTAMKGLEIRNTKCWVNDNNSYDLEKGAVHTSVIQVVDGSTNRIVVKNQDRGTDCGVIECNTRMNIIGSGSIDITYDSSNNSDINKAYPIYGIMLGKYYDAYIAYLCKFKLTIENTKININICGSNSVGEFCKGIYCGEGRYINMDLNINVSNNFHTYGIINYSKGAINGATNFENSNVKIDLKCESDFNVCGINSSYISIKNSNLKVKGSRQAFSSLPTLFSDGDYDSAVLCTSKTYKPSIESYTESDLERYPILSADNISTYKYVEIGQVPNYYYRYKDNNLYKVSKDSSTETLVDSDPSGCTVVDGKLQLNGFNFVTTAPKVIDIVNTDASVGTSIEVLGENNLVNVSRIEETNTICSENNLTINGTGTLNLINKNNATCRGIYVDNNDDLAKLSVNNITQTSHINFSYVP